MSRQHHHFDREDGVGLLTLTILLVAGIMVAKLAAGLLIALGEWVIG